MPAPPRPPPRPLAGSVVGPLLGPLFGLLLGLPLALTACSEPSTATDEPDAARSDGGTADGGTVLVPGKLGLLSLSPARGPLEGGGEVDLLGQEFDESTVVFFGTELAEITWRSGATHLFVTVPAADVPGRVQVRLTNKAGDDFVLPGAYTYLGKVRIDDVSPARGPSTGGTPIEVRGAGFRPGDRILIGYHECRQSRVLDAHTIVAVSPAAEFPEHQDKLRMVVSVRHGSGVANLAKVFTYGRPPEIHRVAPSVVPAAGAFVTLHGRALGNAETLFAAGRIATLAAGTASSSRGAALPALAALGQGAAKTASMLIDSAFGHTVFAPAYAYETGQPGLHGVAPAAGSTAGGQQVALIVELAGAAVQGVTFGGRPASYTLEAGELLATAPAHAAGPVEVGVRTDQGLLVAKGAYTYVIPPKLTSIAPEMGPVAGGTEVRVVGSGLSAGCELRVGGIKAIITDVASGAILARTPPGAPGAADVKLHCGPLSATLPGAFGYTTGGPRINALSPSSGATGGQTIVILHGAGFTAPPKVYFGGMQASSVELLDSGRIRLKTPPHAPGPVAVDVVLGEQSDTLLDGYSYFSPAQPRGGTYGEPVSGTLNVTVLNIYSLKPVEKAWVQLGTPGSALFDKYEPRLTNKEGQVVFSGPDITPPLSISATREQYSASSIVHFGVANATVLLFPWVPPSTGNGPIKPGPPAARITGTVLDLDKYVWVAPGNCTKPEGQPLNPQCDLCELADECTQAAAKIGDGHKWQCVVTGAAGKRCFHTCSSADECSESFACVPDLTDPETKICKPSHGIRHIECTTSCRDLECKEPGTEQPPPVGVVDEKTGRYTLDPVRLDELAVVCRAGYVANRSDPARGIRAGEFIAHTMGVKRNVFPDPGQTIEKVDVKLNIPLRRTLHVRLAHPPKHYPSANSPGRVRLQGWLDLGSDGLLPIADLERNPLGKEPGVRDQETLFRQPLTLPIELTATSRIYRAVVRFGPDTKTTPESGTRHEDVVTAGDRNLRIRDKDGVYTDRALGLDTTIVGVLGRGEDHLFATRNGRLYRGSLENPYLIWLPPVIDVYAQPAVVIAAAGTPTDATIVGRAGLIRRLSGYQVTQEKGVLAQDLLGVCRSAGLRVVVGAKGGLALERGKGWEKLEGNPDGALRSVQCLPGGAIAVGDGGAVLELGAGVAKPELILSKPAADAILYAVTQTVSGKTLVAGAGKVGVGPTLLIRTGKGWSSAWPAGFNPKDIPGLRLLVPLDGATVLAVDAAGGQWRVGPSGVAEETREPRNLRLFTALARDDGSTILAGQPGLWLGPFLSVPTISRPLPSANPAELELEWSAAPGPPPSLNRVHLDGQSFPFWWLYTAPAVTTVKLPDFDSLKGIAVFPSGVSGYVATVERIYVPGLSIDGFSTFEVEFGDRRSWATNYKAFEP